MKQSSVAPVAGALRRLFRAATAGLESEAVPDATPADPSKALPSIAKSTPGCGNVVISVVGDVTMVGSRAAPIALVTAEVDDEYAATGAAVTADAAMTGKIADATSAVMVALSGSDQAT